MARDYPRDPRKQRGDRRDRPRRSPSSRKKKRSRGRRDKRKPPPPPYNGPAKYSLSTFGIVDNAAPPRKDGFDKLMKQHSTNLGIGLPDDSSAETVVQNNYGEQQNAAWEKYKKQIIKLIPDYNYATFIEHMKVAAEQPPDEFAKMVIEVVKNEAAKDQKPDRSPPRKPPPPPARKVHWPAPERSERAPTPDHSPDSPAWEPSDDEGAGSNKRRRSRSGGSSSDPRTRPNDDPAPRERKRRRFSDNRQDTPSTPQTPTFTLPERAPEPEPSSARSEWDESERPMPSKTLSNLHNVASMPLKQDGTPLYYQPKNDQESALRTEVIKCVKTLLHKHPAAPLPKQVFKFIAVHSSGNVFTNLVKKDDISKPGKMLKQRVKKINQLINAEIKKAQEDIHRLRESNFSPVISDEGAEKTEALHRP